MAFHSLVLPVYNEAGGLAALHARLVKVCEHLGPDCEVIFVNDGSRDGSDKILDEIQTRDARFKVIHFSRNFGHQIAISAGIEHACGDTVTVMDADLQDPPELIHEFIAKWHDGFEVVYAVRRKREGESEFKLLTAKVFYRVIRKITKLDIPVDTGDFRLMDRKVVNAFLRLEERHRYIRGLVSWVGFKQTGVLYDRASRASGETHYTLTQMIKLAFDGISSFSFLPLRLATSMGFLVSIAAFLGTLYTLWLRLFTDKTVQGWSSLMVVVLFIGGIQLLSLGIIGEYLGRMFDEVRRRPLYLVSRLNGDFRRAGASEPRPPRIAA